MDSQTESDSGSVELQASNDKLHMRMTIRDFGSSPFSVPVSHVVKKNVILPEFVIKKTTGLAAIILSLPRLQEVSQSKLKTTA